VVKLQTLTTDLVQVKRGNASFWPIKHSPTTCFVCLVDGDTQQKPPSAVLTHARPSAFCKAICNLQTIRQYLGQMELLPLEQHAIYYTQKTPGLFQPGVTD
jgi:hypothetical protein